MPPCKRERIEKNIVKVGPSYFVYQRVGGKPACSVAFPSVPAARAHRDKVHLDKKQKKIDNATKGATGFKVVHLLMVAVMRNVTTKAKGRVRALRSHHNNPDRNKERKTWIEDCIYVVGPSYHVYMCINGKMTASRALQTLKEARDERATMKAHQARAQTVASDVSYNQQRIRASLPKCRKGPCKKGAQTDGAFVAFDPAKFFRRVKTRLLAVALKNGMFRLRPPMPIELMIGCGAVQLTRHFNTQLTEEDTKGAVHVDHIFPLARSDLTTASGAQKANHFTNLQPLPSRDNQSKSDKLPTKAMAARVSRDCWPDGITEDMLPDIYPGWATPLRMWSTVGRCRDEQPPERSALQPQ